MNARLLEWQAQGQWWHHNGQRYFVRQGGVGPTMLLVHGYPVGSYDWHTLWPRLQPHFSLVAPDLLGHGFSDKPRAADYSVAAHADALDALLRHLGVVRCHLVAFDLGVSVAQEMLARRHELPQRLASFDTVTLLNGGLCPQAYQPRWIQRLLISPLGDWIAPRVSQGLFEKTIRRMYGSAPPPSAELLEDFWALVQHGGGNTVAHQVGAFWHTRLPHGERLLGALLHSGLRLRLINGSADPNSGAHMVRAFLQHKPDADVVQLPALGHWPQLQAPQVVVRHVMSFTQPGQ